MSDTITKSKNVSMSRKCGDGITASPRPWRVEVNRFGQSHVLAADDTHVDGPVGPDRNIGAANAALIVAAVNERDRLRDLVRRMATQLSRSCPEKFGDWTREGDNACSLIAEARAAIGEDKQ